MALKTISSIFFIAMLVNLLAFGITHFGTAQASTPVSGILSSDTTWTKANSPYTLTGAVGVPSGVTLTIEAGVTINLGDYYIQVNGTLNAKGSTTDPIYFNGGGSPAISFVRPLSDLYEQSVSSGIIENAILNSSEIAVINSSPKISNSTLRCRISLFNSSSLILNNYFLKSEKSDSAGLVAYDSNVTISGNIFTGMYQALYVGSSQSFSTPLMERNLIAENHYGILMPTSVAFSPIIRNNTIANNTGGIGIWNGGNISSIIVYNNIYDNKEYNFRLTDIRVDINATHNWWGTTDAQAISQSIYDFKKDFALGNVTFAPFLTAPNPQAMPDPDLLAQLPSVTLPSEPSITPNPTIAPSPTAEPNQFNIESNSTVAAFSFNSSVPEITFTVTGPDGTAGYVKATISKNFMPSAENIQVYFDGNPIDYDLASMDNSWIVSFTYQHSTHQVAITAAGHAVVQDWIWTPITVAAAVTIASAVIISVILIVYLRKRRQKTEP